MNRPAGKCYGYTSYCPHQNQKFCVPERDYIFEDHMGQNQFLIEKIKDVGKDV